MKQTTTTTVLSLALAALGACSGNGTNGANADMSPTTTYVTTVNYELALRSAAIKLTGNYPTLTEIKSVRDATDQNAAYQKLIDDYMSRPTFASQMIDFWRDTFRMGGTITPTGTTTMVNLDYAPTFAASLVVAEQPFTNVLTATSNTCMTYDSVGNKFNPATCVNTPAVGVLTDAGVQAQFYSNMAFRRARWVQETFMCQKFPAETSGMPVQHPGGVYASPWDYNSITGLQNNPMAQIDFQDDKSIICANCHTTLNHLAPLFAKYSTVGASTAMIQVMVPVPKTPTAVLTDWLPAGETLSWRFGVPAPDLTTLAQDIAADPGLATCVSSRIWNWAMSRPDIVDEQATLTPDFSATLVTTLTTNNWNVKKLIRSVYTSDSFTRF